MILTIGGWLVGREVTAYLVASPKAGDDPETGPASKSSSVIRITEASRVSFWDGLRFGGGSRPGLPFDILAVIGVYLTSYRAGGGAAWQPIVVQPPLASQHSR